MTTATMGQLRATLIVNINQLRHKLEKPQTAEEIKEASIQLRTLEKFGMENGLLSPSDLLKTVSA